ncbi:hypothetical protein FFK04_07595 [Ruminococcus sp. KGMB03662]|nr:hypothetical protein FFK04_07595 [Ruminococcus sp. KGMB03662]
MVIRLNENYEATLNNALLGYVGETNARPVSVEGMEIDGADRYVLTIDYGDGVAYEVDITDGTWTPTADILRSAQTVSCQIAAKKLSGDEYVLVKKSRIFRLRIGAAIGDTAVPSPDVAVDALDRISAIGEQAHADMQTAVSAAETATTAAENAAKSAAAAGVSADTAEQSASRAETAQTAAETSATQADTARQDAENARQQAATAQNAAKISADLAASAAQQTTADKNATAGYAQTAKTNADSTAADRQAVTEMAAQVTADKTAVADNAAKVAEDRTVAETAAQTAQEVTDSLPEDYTTAVGKIAENTAEISAVKLTDKELQRRVNALYDMGNGVTHRFETDSDTAYQKTAPTGGKLMSVKNIGGRSIVFNQLIPDSIIHVTVTIDEDVTEEKWLKQIAGDTSPIARAIGHKVLGKCIRNANNPNAYVTVRFGNNNVNLSNGSGYYTNTETGIYTLSSGIGSPPPLYFRAFAGATAGTYGFTLQLYDLTAMFGTGNEPASVEEFEAMFPNDYYPYCAGEIVSAGVEEVVEQGKNLLNFNSAKLSRSYRYISDVIPDGKKAVMSLIDKNTSVDVSGISIGFANDVGELDSSVTEFNWILSSSGLNSNNSNLSTFHGKNALCTDIFIHPKTDEALAKLLSRYDIQVELGDTATAYTPYHRNEYAIPGAIRNLPGYGWSAGKAKNYVDYENKQYHQCIGVVDLGTLTWIITSSQTVGDYFYAPATAIGFKKLGAFGQIVHNILCGKYITVARNATVFVDKTIVLDGDSTAVSQIQIKDTAYTDAPAFKQAMSGVMLYYELATPIVTDISGLIDDDFLRNISVEAGGSVTFKNGNGDSYQIPVPSEEEYIVKLSEVGGTT